MTSHRINRHFPTTRLVRRARCRIAAKQDASWSTAYRSAIARGDSAANPVSRWFTAATRISSGGDSSRRFSRTSFASSRSICPATATAAGAIATPGATSPRKCGRCVRRRNSVARPFVVGHSFGGFVVLETGHYYGDRLGGIILADFTVSPPEDYTEWGGRAEREGKTRRATRVYADIETALGRFRLIPEQPCQHPYVVDYIARQSLRRRRRRLDLEVRSRAVRSPRDGRGPVPTSSSRLRCRSALILGEHSEDSGAQSADYMASHHRGRAADRHDSGNVPSHDVRRAIGDRDDDQGIRCSRGSARIVATKWSTRSPDTADAFARAGPQRMLRKRNRRSESCERPGSVVADRSRARLFSVATPKGPLEELEDLVHPEARAHERDLTSDRPGRSNDQHVLGNASTARATSRRTSSRARSRCDWKRVGSTISWSN